ncbi:MAG: SMODS domain-containing nucleotidyltransferase [Vreelandella alkaliphila]|uniref:SMODS domain-containing nucleotidyltransferase n=1 Tax=Halomonadaceae TaxID=28256 RepID=UPI0018661CD7|nr:MULTISPECIES: nucleotidyltransferase [unclassified Halomonas]
MPLRSVNRGFRDFHSALTPRSYESGKASSHKSSITSRLQVYYDLKSLFYSGSANNGTSISGHSDADFFASIPRNKLKKNSSVSLREVKECLQDRFPNTRVYVDSPAVVLDFGAGSWDTAEVIPADYLYRSSEEKNVYDIPDGNGGWIESSPSTHNSYVALQNNRLNKRLKPLIRFVKAWKYYNNVPISSFYLELRITKLMEAESSILYEIDVNSVLKKLYDCNLAPIRDPKGISGLIYPCKSSANKETALSKLRTAKARSQKARDAEMSGNISEAFDWWDKVFFGKFPSYYYYD